MDGRILYFTDSTSKTIDSVEVSGGALSTLSTGVVPTALATQGASLYFGGSGAISKVPTAGGSVSALTGSGPAGLLDLVAKGGQVYWTRATASGGAVLQMPGKGGTVSTLTSIATTPYGLATNGANLYWTVLTGASPTSFAALESIQLSGGSISTVAAGEFDIWDLSSASGLSVGPQGASWVVNATYTSPPNPTAFLCNANVSTGVVTVPWSGPLDPTAPRFATSSDASGVYWTQNGALYSNVWYSLAGGTASTLAFGQENPFGIAAEAGNVYWASQGAGAGGSISGIAVP